MKLSDAYFALLYPRRRTRTAGFAARSSRRSKWLEREEGLELEERAFSLSQPQGSGPEAQLLITACDSPAILLSTSSRYSRGRLTEACSDYVVAESYSKSFLFIRLTLQRSAVAPVLFAGQLVSRLREELDCVIRPVCVCRSSPNFKNLKETRSSGNRTSAREVRHRLLSSQADQVGSN